MDQYYIVGFDGEWKVFPAGACSLSAKGHMFALDAEGSYAYSLDDWTAVDSVHWVELLQKCHEPGAKLNYLEALGICATIQYKLNGRVNHQPTTV